jgi:hypothetical protein
LFIYSIESPSSKQPDPLASGIKSYRSEDNHDVQRKSIDINSWRSNIDSFDPGSEQAKNPSLEVLSSKDDSTQGGMADSRYGYGAEWRNPPAVELSGDQLWHKYSLSHELKG